MSDRARRWLSLAEDALSEVDLPVVGNTTPSKSSVFTPVHTPPSLGRGDVLNQSWILPSPPKFTPPPTRKRPSSLGRTSLSSTSKTDHFLALVDHAFVPHPSQILSHSPIWLIHTESGFILQGVILETSLPLCSIRFGHEVEIKTTFRMRETRWVISSGGKNNSLSSPFVLANDLVRFESFHHTGMFFGPDEGGLSSSEQTWYIVRDQGVWGTGLIPPLNFDHHLLVTKEEELDPRRELLLVCLGLSTNIAAVGDASMRLLLSQIVSLRTFVASRKGYSEFGRVNQALCLYLEEAVLGPFGDFISPLFSSLSTSASLTVLMNLIQPRARVLVDWARLVQTKPISQSRGGALLNALNEAKSWAFEEVALGQAAIEACLFPYLQTLTRFCHTGEVFDPFEEFFIRSTPGLDKAELGLEVNARFWTHKFRLIESGDQVIPWFLASGDLARIVCKTGRDRHLLNTSAELGVGELEIKTELMTREGVLKEFYQSSAEIMAALKQAQVLPVLTCFKRFFLMEQGDFFSLLFDSAREELSQGADRDFGRLEALLTVLLRQTQEAVLPAFLDGLSCTLLGEAVDVQVTRIHAGQHRHADFHDVSSLQCVEVFSLDFTCTGPLAFVLTKRAVTKYQLLFRHLFRCKHAERVVGSAWSSLLRRGQDSQRLDTTTSSLIQRMTQFLQSLAFFTAFDVVEPRWRTFFSAMSAAADIDTLLELHEDFLDSCLRECLLTNPVLIRGLSGLLKLCLALGEAVERGSQAGQHEVEEFDLEFKAFLLSLAKEAKKGELTQHLPNLATRLDFSQFYSNM